MKPFFAILLASSLLLLSLTFPLNETTFFLLSLLVLRFVLFGNGEPFGITLRFLGFVLHFGATDALREIAASGTISAGISSRWVADQFRSEASDSGQAFGGVNPREYLDQFVLDPVSNTYSASGQAYRKLARAFALAQPVPGSDPFGNLQVDCKPEWVRGNIFAAPYPVGTPAHTKYVEECNVPDHELVLEFYEALLGPEASDRKWKEMFAEDAQSRIDSPVSSFMSERPDLARLAGHMVKRFRAGLEWFEKFSTPTPVSTAVALRDQFPASVVRSNGGMPARGSGRRKGGRKNSAKRSDRAHMDSGTIRLAPRSFGRASREVVKFVRTYVHGIIASSTSVDVITPLQYTLAILPGYTEITSAFESYRIRRVELSIHPAVTTTIDTSVLSKPYYFTVEDYDGNSDTTVAQLTEYGSCQVHDWRRPVTIPFVPRVQLNVNNSGTSAPGAMASNSTWIDCADTSVLYYGMVIGLVPQPTTTGLLCTSRVFVEAFRTR